MRHCDGCYLFTYRVVAMVTVEEQEQQLLLPWRGQSVVYLLKSCTTACTYIGYSNNVANRIRKHNGLIKAGAKYTSLPSRRPWRVHCIITGFQSKISALKFEWAWKNCHRSKAFKKMLGVKSIKKVVGLSARHAIAKSVIDKQALWYGDRLEMQKL